MGTYAIQAKAATMWSASALAVCHNFGACMCNCPSRMLVAVDMRSSSTSPQTDAVLMLHALSAVAMWATMLVQARRFLAKVCITRHMRGDSASRQSGTSSLAIVTKAA
eukprot:5478954-Pyramimonas_sp.AAC.1